MRLALDTRELTYPVVIDPTIETWAWRKISSELRRWGPAMAYDAARNQIVAFGGNDGRTDNAETWVWDRTWRLQHPAHSPRAQNSAGMAYDAERANVVLTGASRGALVETWIWDGSDCNQDCIAPADCAENHTCVLFVRPPSSADSCHVGRAPGSRGAWMALLVALARVRRARSRFGTI